MTFWHWSRVTPYTSSCELAESCVFVKQSHQPLCCNRAWLREQVPSPWRHPFSLSYGVNLPSSLTWFLSRTLGFSPYLPVSVYGTGALPSTFRSFSRQRSIGESTHPEGFASHQLSGLCEADLPTSRPTALDRHFQSTAHLAFCVPSSLRQGGTGILTCRPSTTPFGLALGSD